MTSFQAIAPFYDELMRSVPYESWLDYYLLLLEQQQIHPQEVLDVCCGTGTLTEMMARRGFRMAGFDLSAPMIAEARRKAQEAGLEIRYEVSDAAELELGQTFEAAYSFFDSLNYITDPARLREAIRRVGRHVRPGGSFVFDLNTAYAFEQKMFDQQDTRQKSRVRYLWTGEYDPETLIIRVGMEFWVDGVKSTETHVQRAHPMEEVVDMLDDAGFGQIMVYDSYTLDRPRRRSDRIHFTAVRRD